MNRDEMLTRVVTLNRAPTRTGGRHPHKALLLLVLIGRLQQHGSTRVTFDDVSRDLARLIADFAPAVKHGRPDDPGRAALPFVHLERDLWEVTLEDGTPLASNVDRSPTWLRKHGAVGELSAPVQALLSEPAMQVAVVRALLDANFTTSLEEAILAGAGVDPAVGAASPGASVVRRRRDPTFAERVYLAYDYACAVCGYDGALGRNPVGLDAAHIWWHSQGGPDDVSNGCALCVLHHRLLDSGVLGLQPQQAQPPTLRVSPLFSARHPNSRAVRDLQDAPLRPPAAGQPQVATTNIEWHSRLVFKSGI